METAMVYVHIPFCVQKCAYCDFLSFPGRPAEEMKAYIRRVCEDIRDFEGEGRKISSIFFGGGTPSLIGGEPLADIMSTIRSRFELTEDCEISLEMNPCTVSDVLLKEVREAGFNRLSLGVQSFHDEELKALGRVHDRKTALQAIERIRKADFDNFNIDLMSAVPYQTAERWEEVLREAVQAGPAHISAYSLILEEGTPFYDRYSAGVYPLPDEDEERRMYHRTAQILKEAGYERYEISNYALPGRECRHNSGYWKRREYYGFGLGAASLVGSERRKVTEDIRVYITKSEPLFRSENLSIEDEMSEFMFLGLRMMEGVREDGFQKAFGRSLTEAYGPQLRKLTDLGLLKKCGVGVSAGYALTDRGIDVSNTVFCEFV